MFSKPSVQSLNPCFLVGQAGPPRVDADVTLVASFKCFGGTISKYTHSSSVCQGEMGFSIYLPPTPASRPLPVSLP